MDKPIYKRTETWMAVLASALQIFSVALPDKLTPALQQMIFYIFASTLATVATTTITEFTYNVTLKVKEALKSNGGKPWYKKTKLWVVVAGAAAELLVILVPDKFTIEMQETANQIIILVVALLGGHAGVDMSSLIFKTKAPDPPPAEQPPPAQ